VRVSLRICADMYNVCVSLRICADMYNYYT